MLLTAVNLNVNTESEFGGPGNLTVTNPRRTFCYGYLLCQLNVSLSV